MSLPVNENYEDLLTEVRKLYAAVHVQLQNDEKPDRVEQKHKRLLLFNVAADIKAADSLCQIQQFGEATPLIKSALGTLREIALEKQANKT